MQIIHTEAGLDKLKKETSVAIGIFDGIHVGHHTVIQQALKEAHNNNLESVVLTFRNVVGTVGNKNTTQERLMSEDIFIESLKSLGVNILVSLPFGEIKDQTPEEFIKNILISKLNARFISCGEDFKFGKNAQGSWRDLKKIGEPLGAFTRPEPLVTHNGAIVSSTQIRKHIKNGEIPIANDMLGHRYVIDFEVVGGNRIGRTINTPTINQPYPKGYIIPKFGVYATIATVNKKRYAAVTNVGTKPTIGNNEPLAETYIQNFSGDLYGEKIKVEFLQFLRKEKKYDSLDDLRSQIEMDTREAKNIGTLYL